MIIFIVTGNNMSHTIIIYNSDYTFEFEFELERYTEPFKSEAYLMYITFWELALLLSHGDDCHFSDRLFLSDGSHI
jgi:hypothetical protein